MSSQRRPPHVTSVAAPGLAFPRVLSSAEVRPLDAVAWAYRDLRQVGAAATASQMALREISVPADWTAQAAVAFLRSRVRAEAASAQETATPDVRAAIEEIATRLREQGLAGGYFFRAEDAGIFADEITCLLLSQRAAFASANSDAGPPAVSSVPRQTPETAGLADLLASRNERSAGAAQIELALPPEFLRDAKDDQGARGEFARTTQRQLAECIHAGGDVVLHCTAVDVRGGGLRGEPAAAADSLHPPATDLYCPAATLNLARFLRSDGSLDLSLFCCAVQLLTTALEISSSARGPQGRSAETLLSRRSVALSFANLGALLMESGLPYDAGISRSIAGAIAALLCGEALAQSTRIAETCPPTGGSFALRDQPRSVAAGACEAYRRDPATALARLRRDRAAAIQLAAPAQPAPAQEVASSAALFSSQGLARQLPMLIAAARSAWDRALTGAELFGLRNMELTTLSDDRLVADMLDCDTMGVAPEDSLVQQERRTVTGLPAARRPRSAVSAALFRLGYSHADSNAILAALEQTGDLSRAARLRPEHRIIFAVAAPSIAEAQPSPPAQRRSNAASPDQIGVSPAAVLRMFAAVRPFLPTHATPALALGRHSSAEQITELLQQGQMLGIHSLRLHMREDVPVWPRPGRAPIRIMPAATPVFGRSDADRTADRGSRLLRDHAAFLDMQISRTADALAENAFSLRRETVTHTPDAPVPRARRSALPPERASVTHSFSIAGHHGSITVSLYPNGLPGEISIRTNTGSPALNGLLDALSGAISLALQHGAPLRSFGEQVMPAWFEPFGSTANPQIPYVRSVVDYLFRWLELRFLSTTRLLPSE